MLGLKEKLTTIVLKVVLLVIALNAFGGGVYGMMGAEAVPVEWLEGSPFHTYFIPSLILFVVVGGLSLIALINLFRSKKSAITASVAAGLVLVLWIIAQVLVIGFVSALQPIMFSAGILVIFLAKKIAPDD